MEKGREAAENIHETITASEKRMTPEEIALRAQEEEREREAAFAAKMKEFEDKIDEMDKEPEEPAAK